MNERSCLHGFLDFDDLGSAPSTPHYAIDGKTPISNLSFADLQRHIHDLNLQVGLVTIKIRCLVGSLFKLLIIN